MGWSEAVNDAAALAEVLAGVPRDSDRVIVIYPCGDGQSACRWFGMSAEGVANTLYQMADGVVEQRIPLKAGKEPT